jgi:hypothetical protein
MPSVFESQVMLLSSEGDEGSDVFPVTQFDVRSAEVTGIGQKRLRAAEFFRECGQGFHCLGKFVPVHRGLAHPVGQNQSAFIVQNSLAVVGLFEAIAGHGHGPGLSVQADDPDLLKAHLVGDLKDLYEKSIDLVEKAFPEGCDGIMVGMAAGSNVAKGHGIVGGRFDPEA